MYVEYEPFPTAALHMHGKFEQKPRQIKNSIEKTIINERLSASQRETLAAETCNTVNDLALAVGNIIRDLENLDLITTNRLSLGQNVIVVQQDCYS